MVFICKSEDATQSCSLSPAEIRAYDSLSVYEYQSIQQFIFS